jgi:hypothetical protein
MKGISTIAWILIAFVLAIAVAGFFGYWFYMTSGGTGGFISQTQCQLSIQTACKDWESKGFPGTIDGVRVYCKKGIPTCCGNLGDGFKTIDGLGVSEWWDCIAPGCRQKYDIKITSRADCGAD